MLTTAPVSEQSGVTDRSEKLVTLRGGVTVPVLALRILWALEERYFDVRLANNGVLLVAPGSKLTTHDRAAIAQHREALRALVASRDEVPA